MGMDFNKTNKYQETYKRIDKYYPENFSVFSDDNYQYLQLILKSWTKKFCNNSPEDFLGNVKEEIKDMIYWCCFIVNDMDKPNEQLTEFYFKFTWFFYRKFVKIMTKNEETRLSEVTKLFLDSLKEYLEVDGEITAILADS